MNLLKVSNLIRPHYQQIVTQSELHLIVSTVFVWLNH